MKKLRRCMALLLTLMVSVSPAALADDAEETFETIAEFEIPADILSGEESGKETNPVDAPDLKEVEEEDEEEIEEAEPMEDASSQAFAAKVRIELVNTGTIYFGDEVTLRAVIEDANAAYDLRWEVLVENEWTVIDHETKAEYKFVVTEENAANQYRVVVIPHI